jgi:hypothetical protein
MDLWYALGTARGTVRVCGVHVWVTCESVCVTRSTGPPCAARGWHIHRSSNVCSCAVGAVCGAIGSGACAGAIKCKSAIKCVRFAYSYIVAKAVCDRMRARRAGVRRHAGG